ncbi:TonB-dependent receptor [Sphingomonas sp. ST-64]|uniref:TonB-dependent receptor n=1 Tax=Sphingomonas plantiphila TaxID=3163295 RepID=A0ABW8YNL3_9SPHN
MQNSSAFARLVGGVGATALTLMLATGVHAQEAPAPTPTPEPAAEREQEIVISGSRAIVDGTNAPTPVAVVSNEQLKTASPSSLIDGLNQLPVFSSSVRQNSTGSSGSGQGGNGGNYLNLRALLPTRTLVLLDGRRTVASSIQMNATDVTLFPQMLVSRVDVVTGGASAAYGSDAVAGVVNFIIDNKFKGLKVEAQSGISTYGDNFSYRYGAAGGMDFAGGRGNIIASFERAETKGINDANARDWSAAGWGIIPSTIAQTGTTQIIAPDIRTNLVTYGGTIQSCFPTGVACPIANQSFNPDGTLVPFVTGQYAGSSVASGGSGAAVRTNLTTSNWTNTAYLRGQFEFSDSLTFFAEGIYGDVNTKYVGAPSSITSGSSSGIIIYRDNAFLPAAVRATMVANGITSFRMGRANKEIAPNVNRTNTKTWRGVAGFEGKIGGDWNYSLALERSHSHYHLESRGNRIIENFYNGADAVINPATNQPVCRSTLLGLPQGVGCVPIDLFGEDSASPEAIAYASGTAIADLYLDQTNVMLDLRGRPFDTWAGPVSIAFGAEYRKESARQEVDPISASVKNGTGIRGFPSSANGQPGGFALTNPQPIDGEFDVKEAYLEAAIPLARDASFFHSLDINGAVRYADYSTVGGVWTWKAGVSWEPVDGVRFRATRSRDIRAAGIAELFTASQQTAGLSARDTTRPGAPAVAPITRQSRGNPTLSPEEADTFTGGVVLTPFSGVNFSVDYYSIRIKGAITQSTLQQVIDGCAAGNQSLCDLITRDPGGVITTIVTPFLNLAEVKTSGLDIEAGYRTRVGNGQLSLRALANHTFELATTNEGITVDRAGDMGLRDAVAKWTVTGSATYQHDSGTTLFVQGRYISGGKYDSTLGPTALPVAQNQVPAMFYTDVTVKQRIGPPTNGFEVFLTVNNLFDKDPPIAPQGAVTIPRQTNPYFYDMIGRYFTAGAKLRF